MKRFFCLWSVLCATLLFVCVGEVDGVRAQTSTPDAGVAQITSSARQSFPGGISGNGRFVVIESSGNIATDNPRNADANREIFLYDYAQRRIFQITNTKSVRLAPTATPTPTPTPVATATPTPTPTPDPADPTTIDIEISNNKPAISYDGRWIAFSSNAPNPASFDGTDPNNRASVATDGNQEIFLYQIPAVPDADVAQGKDIGRVDLSAGTFIRLTDTPASRAPQPGGTIGSQVISPFVAFDNRDVAINDDASIVAFVSTRNLTGANSSGTPEIFIYNRGNASTTQLTRSQGSLAFSENPSLSGNGSLLAFSSNATTLTVGTTSATNSDGNAEVYLANLNGATLRQVTNTTEATTGIAVNVFSPGHRLSRDGNYLTFESAASLEGDSKVQSTPGLYLYNVAASNFKLVLPRSTTAIDVTRFPTFSGDSTTLVFASQLNFTATGAAASTSTTTPDGLNANSIPQIFSVLISGVSTISPAFERLGNTPAFTIENFQPLQPYVAETKRRIAFGISRADFGTGNTDGSLETYYLNAPQVTSETPASSNAVSYVTGPSQRDVVAASPTPPAVGGLAPGMLAFARSSTVALAPSRVEIKNASYSMFSPGLPIELNGVSMTINGVAAGLSFVSANEVHFVVPIGLAATSGTNTYPVVINNNGAIVRSTLQIISAVPDLVTTSNGALGRAMIFNVTDAMASSYLQPEPFTVTTVNTKGETVATVLGIMLSGARNAQASQITVRIKDTDITGSAIAVAPTDMPGIDQISVTLPATLAGAGDAPVIVTINSQPSRPAETAPHVQIN